MSPEISERSFEEAIECGLLVKEQFLKCLASEIERRGALDVLRVGLKDSGCKFRLVYFRPASVSAVVPRSGVATDRSRSRIVLGYNTGMSIEETEAEALKLAPKARARLAGKLLESLEELSEAENQEAWAEEAWRRDQDLDGDPSAEIAGEQVFRESRAKLE